MRNSILLAALLSGVTILPALAQAPAGPSVRVIGVVQSMSGQNLQVKGSDGKTVSATLASNVSV